MCWALTEGLAGVIDRGKGFDRASISPRWPAAEVEEAEVEIGYECSQRGIWYQFRLRSDKIVIEVGADGSHVDFHVLLPAGAGVRQVHCGGRDILFQQATVEQSRYVNFEGTVDYEARFEIVFI